ncbi:MAG: ABC transporter ATP-binding protein [Coriobacteriales bacterium]|jgi:ABC-2 type transport system ATP-binding protein|nr:ABC transporter ATP-binding protein [Coriobacteriales bacterium]
MQESTIVREPTVVREQASVPVPGRERDGQGGSAAPACSPFVTVRGLTKRYGEVLAVDNLDFEVREGEIFGFLGPNGAGKSTTLNIICSLLSYDRGEVTVAGCDLVRQSCEIRAIIGLVPQEIALFENLTARENVAFFAGLYGMKGRERKEAVAEALAFVGLAEHARKRVGRMSGGMKRRLNIACGIVHHPRLVILDEPTVGVDAQGREHIMNSIRTLRDRGATIIYTSHYLPEVQEICDRIAIIDHGRLIAQGTEIELLEVVTDVKSIVVRTEGMDDAARELLVGRLGVLPDVRRAAFDEGGSVLGIDVALGLSDLTPLLNVLVEQGIRTEAVNSEAPNLEATFLALTGRELR